MPDKLEILEFFLEMEKERLAVSQKSLIKKFDLSASGACHWLSRLNNQGLIEFKFTSKTGNRSYVLAERGRKRLIWLRENKIKMKKNLKEPENSGLDELFKVLKFT